MLNLIVQLLLDRRKLLGIQRVEVYYAGVVSRAGSLRSNHLGGRMHLVALAPPFWPRLLSLSDQDNAPEDSTEDATHKA